MAQNTHTSDGTTSTGTPKSELDTLDALAAQVDAEHAGAMPDGTLIADQPAPVDYAREAAGTVDTIAALIGGYCPPAGELWTDQKKAQVSQALAPVMEKYGFTLGALPPEVTLIVIAGPVLYQSSKLIAADMAQAKAAQAKAPQARATTAPPTDTPEVARHPQTSLYA